MIVMRLVVLVPFKARLDTVEKARFPGLVLVLPFVVPLVQKHLKKLVKQKCTEKREHIFSPQHPLIRCPTKLQNVKVQAGQQWPACRHPVKVLIYLKVTCLTLMFSFRMPNFH